MARKRGLKGRKAQSTVTGNLFHNLETVNRKVTSLKKSGQFGSYASKDIVRLMSQNDIIRVSRKSGKITVRKPNLLKPAQVRLINKRFESFIKSSTSTPSGIKAVQNKINSKVRETLGNYIDRDLTDEELEDFFELTHNESFRYLADKIGDSTTFVVLDYTKQNNLNYNDFESMLKQYIEFSNNSDAARIAQNLYKSIRG